jgi:RNA polymerase sigma factor (sigma-70 family)
VPAQPNDEAQEARPHPHAAQFHTTHWSVVLDVQHQDEHQRAKALEELCRTYWYPVYAFIRRNGHEPADAQDLTQGFFEHVLERHTFETASPEKGRFRSFLLGILKNFLSHERRKASALKRGGSMMFVPIDGQDDEERLQLDLVHNLTPEKLYDRSWTHALLARTIEMLEREYERAGKQTLFAALQSHLTGMASDASYKELGDQLGLSVGAVTTSIHRMRKRYAALLRQEIAGTVSSPAEIEDEISILFSALEG